MKTAPFDLGLAEAGHPLVTRAGKRVASFEVTSHEAFPIRVVVPGSGGFGNGSYSLRSDGRIHPTNDSDYDLFLLIEDDEPVKEARLTAGVKVKVTGGIHKGKAGEIVSPGPILPGGEKSFWVRFLLGASDFVWIENLQVNLNPRDPDADLTSPLQSQVGGDHYRKLAIQPAEYTTRNGLGHLAGDTIAYVTRYKDKNGKQDLEKAIHCLQLLIAIEYPDTTEKP